MSLSSGSAATEHVWLPVKSSDQSWWDRYESVLAESVGSKSRSVIGADAEFIVQTLRLPRALRRERGDGGRPGCRGSEAGVLRARA